MKLATLKDGSRDGRLVVVSHDLTRCTDASFLAPTLQAALDDWSRISPHLGTLSQSLEVGAVPWIRFHEHDAHSPLPRAYQHVGCGDAFVGPRDAIVASGTVAIAAAVAVMTGDVERHADAEEIRDGMVLVVLAAGSVWMPGEAGLSALSPVAVTPDELSDDWRGVLDLPLHIAINGKPVAANAVPADCAASMAAAAALRPLSAGAIVAAAAAGPHALNPGDTIRIEMKDPSGHSIFGAIEQTVVADDHP